MKVSQIRPDSVYLGHGGEAREVRQVWIDKDGYSCVTFKFSRKHSVASCKGGSSGGCYTTEFARWAKIIVATFSDDLRPLLDEDWGSHN